MAKTSKKVVAPVTDTVLNEPIDTLADSPVTTSVEPVQLTVADLQLLSQILDLASRRGAFQASELSQVGDAYNKLTGFLRYVDNMQSKEFNEQDEQVE